MKKSLEFTLGGWMGVVSVQRVEGSKQGRKGSCREGAGMTALVPAPGSVPS